MKNRLSYFMLLISSVMIGIGIHRNEMTIVLKKAINICLECIGVG